MMDQMAVGIRMEDHQIVTITEAMINQMIVGVRMEDHQMDEVEDQQPEEHQMADLLAGMEVILQEVQAADHQVQELLTEEAAIKTGVKAHQQEKAIARHQPMEEELVVKKAALLQAAGEIHVDKAK